MGALTISQRVNAERVVVLGWTRAILLQLAHPLVAAGVADHSSFGGGGLAAVLRLHQTIRAMLALVFGDADRRSAALAGIRAIHRRVHGRLREAAGPFPAGTPYSAEDPALVLWVHATLLESVPLAYELLVRPLSRGERDAYCEEAAPLAVDLGADRDAVPRRWHEAEAYVRRMRASGAIVVSGDARRLAALVVSPPLGPLGVPASRITRLLALGSLPADLRREYEFPWSDADERWFHRTVRALRAARRVTPAALALWPDAKQVSSQPA